MQPDAGVLRSGELLGFKTGTWDAGEKKGRDREGDAGEGDAGEGDAGEGDAGEGGTQGGR